MTITATLKSTGGAVKKQFNKAAQAVGKGLDVVKRQALPKKNNVNFESAQKLNDSVHSIGSDSHDADQRTVAQSNHSLTDVGEPKADISALFPNSGDSQREKSSDENNITLNQYLYSGDSSDKDGDEQSVLTKQTHIELGVENGDVGVVTVSRNKPLEGNEGLASLIKKINGRERLTKDDKAFLETLKLEDFDTLYKEINVEAPRAVSQAKGEARNSRLTEVSKKIGEEELTGGDLEFIKTLKLSNLERLAEKFDRKGLPVPQSLTNTIETRKGDL